MPLLSTRPESFGGNRKRHQSLCASLVAIAHQTVPDSNRKFEQENNLGFPILDDTSGIAAAAFGIGWTSECLRELFEQFSADRTGFNPEVAAIVPMQARYVIGPDDIIAYADINVEYRSEPELPAPRSSLCCSALENFAPRCDN